MILIEKILMKKILMKKIKYRNFLKKYNNKFLFFRLCNFPPKIYKKVFLKKYEFSSLGLEIFISQNIKKISKFPPEFFLNLRLESSVFQNIRKAFFEEIKENF